jgi:PPOX class probable F420-dependent enzyme
MDVQPPRSHADLLDRVLFAHLATVRPDGSPQSNVMWFAWDGSRIRMTHTRTRQKFLNLTRQPRVALSVADPDDQYRFIEVRGVVESIEPDDAQGSFFQAIRQRYGQRPAPVRDAPDRVVITIRPTSYVVVVGGFVVRDAPRDPAAT